MKKIIETIKRKWAEYLLEVLVIVVGIITAFYLDAWHTKNVQEDNLTTILKKTHLNIQPITERNPTILLRQIDTILAALDIIETKHIITKQQEGTISLAFSWVNLNGPARDYNLLPLEQLIESLPVTDNNLALLIATEELINKVNRNVDLIDRMVQQLFDMMMLLDKEIVWFNRDGNARFDYKTLRESRHSIDYLIRGRRWKNWIGYWHKDIVNKYIEVNNLLEARLKELL